MIPMPGTAETNTPAMRRQFSGAIASRAYESILFEAQQSQDGSVMVRNPAHPLVPREVESILALCLLGQYEYLQNGNMEKMQSLTREAVESAMRLKLHIQPSSNQSIFDDARQRTWWTVVCRDSPVSFLPSGDELTKLEPQYLCACNVTIVSCVVSVKLLLSVVQKSSALHGLNVTQPPIMPFKDPAYTATYPGNGDWKAQVNAERLLVLATLFLVNLIREFGNPSEMELIRRSMQVLDGEIAHSLFELDATISPFRSSFQKKVALIRLHRYVLHPSLQLMSPIILTGRRQCADQSPSLLCAAGRRQCSRLKYR